MKTECRACYGSGKVDGRLAEVCTVCDGKGYEAALVWEGGSLRHPDNGVIRTNDGDDAIMAEFSADCFDTEDGSFRPEVLAEMIEILKGMQS